MTDHIDGQTLLDYIGNFSSEAFRKQTLDSIVSDKLLKKFYSTPEGKKALEFFTTRLSEDVSNMIQVALAWDADIGKRTEKLIHLGTRAGIILANLKEMAFQMTEGEKHIKLMKKETR